MYKVKARWWIQCRMLILFLLAEKGIRGVERSRGLLDVYKRRLMNNGAQTSMSQALEAEGQAQAVNFGTQDTSEAARAWGEKRQPEFEGR